MPPDYGPGFGSKGECRTHGNAFLTRQINDEDVAETLCLACLDPSILTKEGRAVLSRMRSEATARKVTASRG